MKRLLVPLAIALPLLASAVAAQPQSTTQLVYGLNAFDGEGYSAVFSPSDPPNLYLLADNPSVLQVKRTEVYYWPATEQYVPDWGARNEDVEGRLQIRQGSNILHTLQRQPFVLVFPQGSYGPRQLVTGEAAIAAYDERLRLQSEYERALDQFRREHDKWLERARRQGPASEPKPQEPEKPTRVVSKPMQGFVVNLPAGRYSLALVASEGSEIAGSRRELTVLTARRRGIGYRVIPPARWTSPLESYTQRSVIYATGSDSVFVQPMVVQEFNELLYARLKNPQDKTASAARWTWVGGQMEFGRPMQLGGAAGAGRVVASSQYLVEQVEGQRLGYRIVRHTRETLQPHERGFRAYEVPVPASGRIRIALLCGDEVCPASEREIRRVRSHFGILYGLAAVPLVVALGLVVRRRTRSRISTVA